MGEEVVSLCGADLLIACGEHAADVAAAAAAAGMPRNRAMRLQSTGKKRWLMLSEALESPATSVLVKGARTLGLERIVDESRQLPSRQASVSKRGNQFVSHRTTSKHPTTNQ